MALVPLKYNLRSLFVRRSSTVLAVVSIAATVGVLAAVLALQAGFQTAFTARGRTDLAIVLRAGAGSEGESGLSRKDVDLLVKESPEFALDDEGRPLASAEVFLALRNEKVGGGETNVPVRGVGPQSFAIHGDTFRIRDGRNFEPGSDEVIVGWRMSERAANCRVGDVLQLNLTPFRVVGTFEAAGAYESEVWGDAERILEALERPVFNRVIGQLRDGVTAADLSRRLEDDKRLGVKALDEQDYLTGRTQGTSLLFAILGTFLLVFMGAGAVFTGINSMYAAISARTREVGILLSLGFRPAAIFLSFLFEAALLGLLGGLVGLLLTLPLNGISTGTTNFQTFSEVAFQFRISPEVMVTAVGIALVLGVVGGAWPAWRAARMGVTEALRRH